MLKKIFSILIMILLMISMCGNVNATELKTSLNIIQKASETKYLENDQGFVSKTIVDSNSDSGEVTIELKVSNSKKKEENKQVYENTEIYILVSENIANNTEKLTKNINNIENLASNILKRNEKTKIGIIGITGTINDSTVDEKSGKLIIGDKDEGKVNGNANNAEIVVNLTNNLDTIKNGLQNMNSSKTGYNPNLQAAIRLANKSYSNNTNKILISLYDNVPSIAIGVYSRVSYGGLFSEYSTPEEAVIEKHEKISTYTKNEILTLKTSNVSFILLRPDDTSYNETWYSNSTGEKELDFDGSPYVQKLYGTIENPIYGKMYSFTDENIEKIITQNIYQDVKDIIQPDINTIKIVDYFPKDITDNFEFSYVGNPSVGTRSNTIDTESKTITWDIGTLKGNEVATLKYKLKIKDMKNADLLNKTIATNEKVVLTYKDTDAKDYAITLTSSPKIKLSQVKEELTAKVSYSPTTKTTENVVATIKTNKKVNKVDGWTLSNDGKTLTKTYSTNATETVHLVDLDGMTKDVTVKITNITSAKSKQDNEEDTTTAKGILPQTGVNIIISIASIIAIILIAVVLYKKYNSYKDIK